MLAVTVDDVLASTQLDDGVVLLDGQDDGWLFLG